MKKSKVVNIKYKGYLIKPDIQGFRIYRKEYLVDVYPTLQVAKSRIDAVVKERHRLIGKDEKLPEDAGSVNSDSGQINLF